MAIFTNTSYVTESVDYDNIQPTMEGSSKILYEFSSDIYKLIGATYVADVMIESAVNEGATDIDAVLEGTAKDFKKKVVEKFKELKNKIVAWFKRVIEKIKVFFMGSKKFVEQYEDTIKNNFNNMKKKPTYNGYDYMETKDMAKKHETVVKAFKDRIDEVKDFKEKEDVYVADTWVEETIKKVDSKASNVSELKENLKKEYYGGNLSKKDITINNVTKLIDSVKDKGNTITTVQTLGNDIEHEIEGIISDINGTKDNADLSVITVKTNMFKQCVTIIQGVTSVTVSALNESARDNLAVLKKIVTMKPAKESFEETGSIFESALNII